MRSRLTALALVAAFAATVISASSAGAQVPPTHGELIPGGGASASANHFDQDSGPAPVAPRGYNTNRSCWYEARLVGENYTRVSLSQLQQRLGEQQAAGGGEQLQVRYVCEDADTGANRTVVPTTWPGNGSTAFVVPPLVLAQQARQLLWPPPPRGTTTPSLGEGSVAQLDTYFTVGNWAPVSVTATAGPNSATVTATPVSQTWVIQDQYRGTSYTVECAGAGVNFDPASGLTPPADACVWEDPPHSSAGQTEQSRANGPVQGEPCFPVTVTIGWDVTWRSGSGPEQPLPPGLTSAASTCIVVKEIQAVVSGDPGG
jgi:hypothetical protein